MGITIRSATLLQTLEDAVRLAESGAPLPETWTKRVEHIAQCPSATYIAALGTALLARACDGDVDVLAIKSSSGPTGYSMRSVVKVLAGRANHYGYHLGVTGAEPLNNQPWFSHDRVDAITRSKPAVVPFQQAMVRYLRDLQALTPEQALPALAAFLRLRLAAGAAARANRHVVIANAGAAVHDVIAVAQAYIRQDPEGGRRGQAVVAGMLDAISDDVETGAINNPRSFDVSIRTDTTVLLAVEVKQKPVGSEELLFLAQEAAAAGADKALYAALSADQAQLDRVDLRKRAAADHGVLLTIAHDLEELAELAYGTAPPTAAHLAEILPSLIVARLERLRVSDAGIQYWRDLFVARAG